MDRNTKIRGVQINSDVAGHGLEKDASGNLKVKLDGSSLAVGASGIKLGALNDGKLLLGNVSNVATAVTLTGDVTTDNAGVTAIGATKVVDSMVNDDVATGLAGVGLSDAAGVMAVDLQEVAEVAIAVADDYFVFLDGGVAGATKKESVADLATAMAGTGITATNGVLSSDTVADNIVEGDIQKEDESANCNGATVAFTLSNTPVANSVQVYLNGLLQQGGSGDDYTIAGTTVTFADAPETGDLLVIYYITDNA